MTGLRKIFAKTDFAPLCAAQAGGLAGAPGNLLLFSSASDGSGENRVVRGERRRRAEPPASGRERAEAPRRETPGQGAPPSWSGGGGGVPRPPSGGGPGLPLGGPKSLMSLALLVILACIFVALQLFGGDAGDTVVDQPVLPAETSEPFEILPLETPTRAAPPPTITAAPVGAAPTSSAPTSSAPTAALSPAAGNDQTWLVMLYQDADDKILEQDIYMDLNEAERAGSSPRVQIVAQIDRYRGGFQGDGDWSTTRRYLLTQDDDLNRMRSQMVADLGEVNMADSAALVDFVEWAVKNYPADRYVLIMSDHGMGWPGGWSDAAPQSRGDARIPLAARLGGHIFLHELDRALGEIRARTGIEKFDVVGLDACLMAQLEVFSALAPHARYAVASEEVEPALGWAYASFLEQLNRNPDIDPGALSRLVVQSYIDDDQRIQDDQARADLLRQGGGMSGMFGLFGSVTPDMLARQLSQDITLTAVDLGAIPAAVEELNQLAYAMQNESQPQVARARAYAQSFTSIFGSKVPPSFIDLGNFAQILNRETSSREVKAASERLIQALGQAVIAERHGPKKAGATGVSIYFPNSDLYRTPEAGARSYTMIAGRFAQDSLWDDFLAFHYAGKLFEPQVAVPAVPESGAAIRGPGAGQIQLSRVSSSSSTAAPGQPVLLSADISGENVGYVYLYAGFYDRAANSVFVADMDYIESGDTREVGGVYYPDWGEGDFTLEFEWEPLVFAIDDGSRRVPVLFTPQSYGATFEEAVYSVDGIYVFGDSGERRNARLLFSDGTLRRVVGFTGDAETGAPREIVPQPGDQFIILERWLDLDLSGRVTRTAEQEGETLTFSSQSFRWVELDAAAGDYIVGFIVEDLDGNASQAFTTIAVH
ncbi:MAG: hypothetical protein IT316_10140 [Anaerolineales bacterium]|nr:hypothetical protein [Anaerolineales bacterium]